MRQVSDDSHEAIAGGGESRIGFRVVKVFQASPVNTAPGYGEGSEEVHLGEPVYADPAWWADKLWQGHQSVAQFTRGSGTAMSRWYASLDVFTDATERLNP